MCPVSSGQVHGVYSEYVYISCMAYTRIPKNPRFLDTRQADQPWRPFVYSNSVHQSTSRWWVVEKLLDSMGLGLPIAVRFYRVA
jgi:hypothetical protein